MELFDGGGIETPQEKLDAGVKELRANRKVQFDKMTEMLTSGKVNDMSLEEKENFVKLYKLLKQHHSFNEGGLKDEGGTIDPVSGNDVPVGSMQNEVRDDIPAQLSEGEFVFPADVVRYIGLEKLMQMRQEAKRGLEMMEKMGQMGNADEAVIPDDIPFELSDLDMEDDPVEMQQGGVAGVSTVPSQVPATSFVQAPPPPVTTMPIPPTPASVPIAPTYTPATQQEVPTFTPEQMKNVSFPGVVQTPESAPQTVEIINPTTGERRTITYIPGVTQLPEGFVLASEYTAPDKTTVTPTVGQAQVRKSDKDDDDPPDFSRYEAMQARIKEAERLRFMDVVNPFEQLFKSTVAGSMFGSKFKQGQVVNGYIADGMGNLYDPITGGYVQKDGILGQLGEFFRPVDYQTLEQLPQKSKEFRDDLLSLIIDKDPTIMSATNASNEIKKVSDSISKALQSGNKEDKEKAQKDSDNFSKTYLSGKSANEIRLAEELRREEKESNFDDIIAKAKAAARPKVSNLSKTEQALAQKEAQRKADKAADKREKKVQKTETKEETKKRKKLESSYDAMDNAKGGLASKSKPKPKKMRQGGLASR